MSIIAAVKTMAKNDRPTTGAGLVAGIVYYLTQDGVKVPATRQEWGNVIVASALVAFGFVARSVDPAPHKDEPAVKGEQRGQL